MGGTVLPAFKRYKRPSFELKLRRNAWADRGSAPDSAVGAYNTPQDPLAQLRALLLKGMEGRRREVQGRREGKEGEGKGREGRRGKKKGRGSCTPHFLRES